MPNEVYEVTHTALSALVSQRAATRVLDVALQAGGADANTITVRAMRRLLAGRVRRELSGTLPSPGLTRSLKQIAPMFLLGTHRRDANQFKQLFQQSVEVRFDPVVQRFRHQLPIPTSGSPAFMARLATA